VQSRAASAEAIRPRRTQEARSFATRTQLLDATIACLDELGFARTTTTEIAQRAGVSRGAQLHHFPTKQELVVTAVEHLFERRHTEFMAAFAARPADSHPLEAAIDLLWANVNGPVFHAFLELLVAARTDPGLHARVAPLTQRFSRRVEATFQELFGDRLARGPLFSTAPRFAFALLDGLALNRITEPDATNATQTIDTLKLVARMLMPPATTP
jgi:AcrR family transcriptional regulator